MFYKFDLLILDLTFATDLDFYKELFFRLSYLSANMNIRIDSS